MRRWLFFILLSLSVCRVAAQGVPFFRNFTTDDYHAHNRNFDVDIDKNGIIYIANFEGLMYYDHAEWRILHTPGITRITVVYCDHRGMIWTGGYNYFGCVVRKSNGELALKQIGSRGQFRGEVIEIWEEKDELFFLINNGQLFKEKKGKVSLVKTIKMDTPSAGLSDVVDIKNIDKKESVEVLSDVTQEEQLDNGLVAVVRRGHGITVKDSSGRELYTINEDNGLCSNFVNYVAYDGHGTLWGATDDGVFAIAVPSSFSHFTALEGLAGELQSICEYKGVNYIGTSSGLFKQIGWRMEQIPGINHACWMLSSTNQGLLAATASGLYRFSDGVIKQLTLTNTISLLVDDNQIYSGEMDGVYLMDINGGNRKLICKLEKVVKMTKDADGTLWLQNMYGEVWKKQSKESKFVPYSIGVVNEKAATVVPLAGDKVSVVTAVDTRPFPYPLFSFIDKGGVTWLTNSEGKELYRWKDGHRLTDLDAMLYPFSDLMIHTMFSNKNEVWLGGDKGLVVIDTSRKDLALDTKPKMLFRSVTMGNDSVLWGGMGSMPKQLPELGVNQRSLRFTFSLDYVPLVGKTLYRYRLGDGKWSGWTDENDVEYLNLPYGSYTIAVQARLANGQLSEITTMDFSIAYPFYLRWYMGLLYLLLIALLVMLFFRYRLHRLNMEKQKLERIVQERTSEVVKQKDEIEEKSRSLETALNELHQAQGELIRQEKMATVGKLTQGLIDRILNPLNYINNFSKLSEGLVKDVEANVEDEKEHMDQENYDDTMDVLDMLRGNLKKVGEHGQNTTRTLKAMEEMLKDRSGGIVPMSLTPVLKQDADMLNTYYADDISKHGIKTVFDIPEVEIRINGNAEQLSKMMMSLLANAVYAVVKKAQREKPAAGLPTGQARAYVPEISFKAAVDVNHVSVTIRDNGIGIEDTIIEKIFDPFFTTKTTGEAAGVGLYLSREIVQNHGGDIQVESVKNDYSEFTITLPTLKA